MTAQALIGLFALNVLLYFAGLGLLMGIRGLASWGELARFSGLAYMLGVASVGVVIVVELVLGIPFGVATLVLTALVLGAGGIVAGRVRGHPHVGAERLLGPALVAGVGLAFAAVYLEAMFRSGRLAQLTAWDGMAFWLPKGKAIYFLDGLDERFFQELPNAGYPPLVPALEAAAFEFMGDADVVTVHLQFWFPLVGFTAAVAGLLASRVSAWVLWPSLLLVVVAPQVGGHALLPLAVLVLDYFVALAALLIALWLIERAGWQLVLGSVFLSAAMLTKREGLVFAACIVVAALAVSWREPRWAWPRLLLAAAAAFLPAVSWQVWLRARDIAAQGPEAGGVGLLDHLNRAWPSFELAVSTLYDYELWLVVMPLATIAVVAAFIAGARVLPSFTVAVGALATLGFTWATWAFPTLPITKDAGVNPISRVTGGLVVVFAGLLPLLLAAAWHGREYERKQP